MTIKLLFFSCRSGGFSRVQSSKHQQPPHSVWAQLSRGVSLARMEFRFEWAQVCVNQIRSLGQQLLKANIVHACLPPPPPRTCHWPIDSTSWVLGNFLLWAQTSTLCHSPCLWPGLAPLDHLKSLHREQLMSTDWGSQASSHHRRHTPRWSGVRLQVQCPPSVLDPPWSGMWRYLMVGLSATPVPASRTLHPQHCSWLLSTALPLL